MSKDWTIFGTGAHSRKVAHTAQRAGDTVAAFVDELPVAASPLPGVPVLPSAVWATSRSGGDLFVAIGLADVRRRLMDEASVRGWHLPALVHPLASVAADVALGDGVLVAAGAVVESGARIGRGAIIDIGVIVDHDCVVDAFCHLRPGQLCPAGSVWPA
jgi:hypothetical protein